MLKSNPNKIKYRVWLPRQASMTRKRSIVKRLQPIPWLINSIPITMRSYSRMVGLNSRVEIPAMVWLRWNKPLNKVSTALRVWANLEKSWCVKGQIRTLLKQSFTSNLQSTKTVQMLRLSSGLDVSMKSLADLTRLSRCSKGPSIFPIATWLMPTFISESSVRNRKTTRRPFYILRLVCRWTRSTFGLVFIMQLYLASFASTRKLWNTSNMLEN